MADKVKIAMIDDEPDLCSIVKENLERKGNFTVATTSDPQQAESFIKQEQPNLILLDVVMPGRSGAKIIEAIKKDPDTKKIPIIIVSGKGEMVYNKKKDDFKWIPNTKIVKERGILPEGKGSAALSQAYGVDDYVSKPFTTDMLVEIINDVMAKYKKAPASADDEKPV